eukprot:NODE_3037_length_1042_cov_25.356284_g2895_i0.p1 GENE.NODE_3037_length_1042_cov_25.356284_g2895_i0~~NODE_3037_length_1042_cov_25.356284_g2895_i0.p1  ORF type:complete len:307 (-),score=87.74 NODE_3037_length_1042_cov_25.356284_g2895_i0:121-993(-)
MARSLLTSAIFIGFAARHSASLNAKHKSIDDEILSSAGKWHRTWNTDWDGRAPTEGKASGKTRHIMLIRHGQYNLDNDTNDLTLLGQEQSHLTGKRLAAIAAGVKSDHYGTSQAKFQTICTSDLTRAKETAEILHQHLPTATLAPCDPLLSEGYPCIPLPDASGIQKRPAKVWAQGVRVEAAFRKYFHRDIDHKKSKKKAVIDQAYSPEQPVAEASSTDTTVQDWTIIVCHMNVIRYFVCRALQLPPEAWLRMSGNNCGITELVIRPNGRVSLVKFADTGHIPIEKTTFH